MDISAPTHLTPFYRLPAVCYKDYWSIYRREERRNRDQEKENQSMREQRIVNAPTHLSSFLLSKQITS